MKFNLKLFQLGLLVAIAAGASVANAQDDNIPLPPPVANNGMGSGSIAGRVVLPSGHPVNGRVRITLSTLEIPGMTAYTDNNGGFGFRSLREGNYVLEVAGDYKLYEPIVEQVRVNRGMQVVLTISLKEKNPSNERPEGGVVSAGELDQRVPASAKKEYDKATGLVKEGKAAQAIDHYKRALEIYSEYLMARNDLGVQYLNLKRLAEAAEQFEAAIEINAKVFNPRLNLGIVLVEQKKFPDAIEHLNHALAIDSARPAAHLYFGIASLEIDELQVAERELLKALALGNNDEYSIAHYYIAQVDMKKGDRDGAMRELKTYLDSSPEGEKAVQSRMLLEKLKRGRYQ
jgi:tetratricopeptide (TPR) repeat protein